MDADFKEKRSARISSQREKRWSMNSQRLEEIVAELMRPIGDLRHCFDTDLSALLEEYLTEAGLHALEADDSEDSQDTMPDLTSMPNFTEVALLLQQSANIYGRKVDFLYQHVLNVSDSLQNSTIEIANHNPEQEDGPVTPSTTRRKRRSSVPAHVDFTHITLESSPGSKREAEPPRPPPTLPRVYIELEPRVMADSDAALKDYANEPIGLLADFHVGWRLQDGLLVDELEGATSSSGSTLRPIPLMELQAAIEANAPPPLIQDPPLTPVPPLITSTPLHSPPSTPIPEDMPPPALKKDRKRKNNTKLEDMSPVNVKILISKEVRRELSRAKEFSIPDEWIRAEVRSRTQQILNIRSQIRAEKLMQEKGFLGWSPAECAAALESAHRQHALSRVPAERARFDSDDDGFFEQSSLGSDISRADDSPVNSIHNTVPDEWCSWQAGVVSRAAAAEARGALDVRALGQAVMAALPQDGRPEKFDTVLRHNVKQHTDVASLFLSSLFLANSGNVEIIQGAPLTLDSFMLKLVSTDARRLTAAAAAALADQAGAS